MENPKMRNTVFGEVLAELLEERGEAVTPLNVGKLAEDAGIDGGEVIDRMACVDKKAFAGRLSGLPVSLGLSKQEEVELAYAYTFERRAPADPSIWEGLV